MAVASDLSARGGFPLVWIAASLRGGVWGVDLVGHIVGAGDWDCGVSPTRRGPACTPGRSHVSRTSRSRPGPGRHVGSAFAVGWVSGRSGVGGPSALPPVGFVCTLEGEER